MLTVCACRYERPVGLLVTLYVHIVYTLALKFEGCATFSFIFFLALELVPSRPFTDMIYSTRDTSTKKFTKKEL
jgi:phosphatidylethanolamine N-methyltransferase